MRTIHTPFNYLILVFCYLLIYYLYIPVIMDSVHHQIMLFNYCCALSVVQFSAAGQLGILSLKKHTS